MHVTCQIAHDIAPVADRFHIHNPAFLPGGLLDCCQIIALFRSIVFHDLAPQQYLETFGDGAVRHQIIRLPRAMDALPVRGQSQAWHDHMDVRMIEHFPRPGVQHGGEPGRLVIARTIGHQPLVPEVEGFERVAHGVKQEAIEPSLVRVTNRTQFFGQCEGEHVIAGVEQFALLPLRPFVLLVLVALRTGAVVATVIMQALPLAGCTLIDLRAQRRRATCPHRRRRTMVRGGQQIRLAPGKGVPMPVKYLDRHPQDSSRNGDRGEHPTASNLDVELHDDSEGNERIPKTLDEALDLLMEGLTDEDRKIINNLGDDYAALVHHGAGMGLRNSGGLWVGDSPLKRYFTRLGIFHADNMSGIINVAFSRRVRGKPIELNRLVQDCRDGWEKEDVIAPLDLICPHCHKEMLTDYAGPGHSKAHPERVYFYGGCPCGHHFYFYHQDGWLEGRPEYGEQDGADGLLDLASSHEDVGDYAAALTDYEKALRLNPKSEWVSNDVAWFLATTPAPAFRDGKRSLALAQNAVKIADQPEPRILDTLAASYAATGDFKSATAILEQAISLTSDDSLRSKFSTRLGLYKASTPYISPPASAPKGEQVIPPNDR